MASNPNKPENLAFAPISGDDALEVVQRFAWAWGKDRKMLEAHHVFKETVFKDAITHGALGGDLSGEKALVHWHDMLRHAMPDMCVEFADITFGKPSPPLDPGFDPRAARRQQSPGAGAEDTCLVFCCFVMTGRHSAGELYGLPVTHRRVNFPGMLSLRLNRVTDEDSGKSRFWIRELWAYYDAPLFCEQLGLKMPLPVANWTLPSGAATAVKNPTAGGAATGGTGGFSAGISSAVGSISGLGEKVTSAIKHATGMGSGSSGAEAGGNK